MDHHFIYPCCPQRNARVERKTKSSQHDYWDHRLWGKDLEDLNHMSDEWNYIYNHVRLHQSLGYLTPAEFLRQWQDEKRRGDMEPAMRSGTLVDVPESSVPQCRRPSAAIPL